MRDQLCQSAFINMSTSIDCYVEYLQSCILSTTIDSGIVASIIEPSSTFHSIDCSLQLLNKHRYAFSFLFATVKDPYNCLLPCPSPVQFSRNYQLPNTAKVCYIFCLVQVIPWLWTNERAINRPDKPTSTPFILLMNTSATLATIHQYRRLATTRIEQLRLQQPFIAQGL